MTLTGRGKLNICIKTQYRLCSRAIEDYMTEKVQFVVTSEGWHESFEDVSLSPFFFPLLLLRFFLQPN